MSQEKILLLLNDKDLQKNPDFSNSIFLEPSDCLKQFFASLAKKVTSKEKFIQFPFPQEV